MLRIAFRRRHRLSRHRILLQEVGVAHGIGIVSDQIMRTDVAHIVRTRTVDCRICFETDVHLNGAGSLIVVEQTLLAVQVTGQENWDLESPVSASR